MYGTLVANVYHPSRDTRLADAYHLTRETLLEDWTMRIIVS